jgi:4-amino-4-deoxychorismate lyase
MVGVSIFKVMRVLALLDGTLADPDSPIIRVDDLGLMRGDGIFETVLVVDGVPRELGPHFDRLVRSAAMLDLPTPDRAAFDRATQAVLAAWTGGAEMALKWVYTRGVEGGDGTPTGFALGLEIAGKVQRQRAEGIAAITLERGIDEGLAVRAPWLLFGAKTLSYAVNMAAIREAERRGAAEVVFTTSDGFVLEGPTSTLVAVSGKTLRTPPAALGILPGTTQAALFRAAEREGWVVQVEPMKVSELLEAEGLFLASSVRKVTRIHTLDGEPLADSTPLLGELTRLYDSEYQG